MPSKIKARDESRCLFVSFQGSLPDSMRKRKGRMDSMATKRVKLGLKMWREKLDRWTGQFVHLLLLYTSVPYFSGLDTLLLPIKLPFTFYYYSCIVELYCTCIKLYYVVLN